MRTVPGVVGCRDDVAVLLGGGPIFLDHEAPARRRMEREEQAPRALGGIAGRQVERVRLRRVVGALDPVDHYSALEHLGARAVAHRHNARVRRAMSRRQKRTTIGQAYYLRERMCSQTV